MEIALALRNLARLAGQCGMKTMKILFWDVICLAVLRVVLTPGLPPFHSPNNGVTRIGNHNGLRFGRYGTVIRSGTFRMTSAEHAAVSRYDLKPTG